ncbi:MAG: sialidase family protein [Bryobacteraceae bacterium]
MRRSGSKGSYVDLHRSDDNGSTWKLVSEVTPEASSKSSNPPSMIRLKDGRLCVTYGHRLPPYGIKARISSDEGKTWAEELWLRTGAGNHDLGYPRTVQRPDGKIVTIYYYNDNADGERYIAATIWEP